MEAEHVVEEAEAPEEGGEAPLLIGEAGRKCVGEMLVEYDPKAVIDQMHATLGIGSLAPTVRPLLSLLDLLGVSRAEAHAAALEALRAKLVSDVKHLSQLRVLALLDRVIPFMGVAELTPVCAALLAHCGQIPPALLATLAEPDNYAHAPLAARQQIWLVRDDLLREAVFPLFSEFLTSAPNVAACHDVLRLTAAGRVPPRARRAADATVREVVALVGGQRALYLTACGFLRTLFVNTNEPIFCSLRATLLMATHDRELSEQGEHVSQWDPCHRFAWTMDAAIRDGRCSALAVKDMSSFLPPHGDLCPRDPLELGDLAMILRDPHALHALCATALRRLRELVDEAAYATAAAAVEGALTFTITPKGAHVPRSVAAATAAAAAAERKREPPTDEQLGAVAPAALRAAVEADGALCFVARALQLAHDARALLAGEAAVPTDDRSIARIVSGGLCWLAQLRLEDSARHARAAAAGEQGGGWLEQLPDPADDDADAADAAAERACSRAPKRPRRATAGARGRTLAAAAAAADGSADEGASEGGDGAPDEEEEAGDKAAEAKDAHAVLLASSPSIRRLVLRYALLRARALDVPRCTQLLRLAADALGTCAEQHLDFILSLVELLSQGSAAAVAAAAAAAAAASAGAAGAHGNDEPAEASSMDALNCEQAAALLFEAALHTFFLPMAPTSAHVHEQLVLLLCVHAARAGAQAAAELARWASANGAYDDSGLVDRAYKALFLALPELRGRLPLGQAREAALKRTPSSAASDVVSDGTHMEHAAALQAASWDGGDGDGSDFGDDGATTPFAESATPFGTDGVVEPAGERAEQRPAFDDGGFGDAWGDGGGGDDFVDS